MQNIVARLNRYPQRIRKYWLLVFLVSIVIVAAVLFVVARVQATQPSRNTIDFSDTVNALMRYGVRPDGEQPDVEVFLVTPTHLAITDQTLPRELTQEPSIIFYVSEQVHYGELPLDLARPLLRVDKGSLRESVSTRLLVDSEHHRSILVRYSALDSQGDLLVTENTDRLQVIFPDPEGDKESAANVLTWKLPIEYNEGFASWEVVASSPPPSDFGNRPSTWAVFLAIMAGMLIALSPCLIQLGLYYTATIAAVAAEGNEGTVPDMATAKRHIVRTGLFFAAGFTLVYTIAGAAAGSVGASLDTLGLLNTWVRPLSVVAGIMIILLALRVAWNARAPLVCNLPLMSLFGQSRRTGVVTSALMGISFAGGCLACFSATVLPALLLYVGSTGSVAYGALLLFIFSLGITLPCLGLAFGISRFQPLLQQLPRFAPILGLASAVVMAGFGVLMITFQFHIVSGFIYQLLNLR